MKFRAGVPVLLISVTCLVVSCAGPNKTKRGDATEWKAALKRAIRNNDVFAVSQILAQNSLPADVALNANSVTPLMVAASLGGRKVVEWLLVNGAEVDSATTLKETLEYPEASGCTALFMACAAGHLEIDRLLVDHGAKVNLQDSHSNTPLVMASARGHVDVAKFLVERGADLNYRDSYGATPLLRAIQMNQHEVAEFLIDHGADVNASFDNRRNVLMLESISRHEGSPQHQHHL